MIDEEGASAALRRAFDEGFAAPVRDPEAHEDLLAIRLGEHPFALRIREIAEITRALPVLRVPSPAPEHLGLVGHRGETLAVWDLAALLGQAPLREAPRWLAITRGEARVALGFQTYDGYLRAGRSEVFEADGSERVVRTRSGVCAIVALSSVVKVIRERVGLSDAV